MTFKKMRPNEFSIGKKYRTNDAEYGHFIYTCTKVQPAFVRLERDYGWTMVDKYTKWLWEEIKEKKRVYK